MKNGVLIILLLVTGWLGMAQNHETPGITEYVWVDQLPIPLNKEQVMSHVLYPYKAMKSGIEGAVFVRVLVDEEGEYQTHLITRSAHPLLSAALSESIDQLDFVPATQGDQPVSYWVNLTFDFKITQAMRKQSQHNTTIPLLGRIRNRYSQEDHLAEGIHLMQEQEYEGAIFSFSRCIQLLANEKKPSSTAGIIAYLNRANIRMTHAEWELANSDLTEAIGQLGSLHTDSALRILQAQLFLSRGIVRLYLDRPVDALEDFNWLQQQLSAQLYSPGSSVLEINLGLPAYRDMLPLLVQLAYYNETNPIVDFLVGHVCRHLEMNESAAEAFILALNKAENPVFKAFLYDHLGETLLELSQYSEALSTTEEAKLLTTDHPLPHYNRAMALLKLDRRNAAIGELTTALEMGLPEPEKTTARSILQVEKSNSSLAGQP